jgi:hypothetical protein
LTTAFRILFCFILCIGPVSYSGQNFDDIGKKNLLKISGGVDVSSVFYSANGSGRRQPFTYYFNGNVTGNILGISLPFTFNYTSNQVRYSQPANFQSFTPSYKWAKAYVGITALNFSQYTQASHPFTGIGVELTPGKFKVALLFGIFKKAREYDYELNSDTYMSYKRTGMGSYIGYEDKGHALKIIYFLAKDDPGSIHGRSSNISPMKNSVVSLVGKTTLLKKLTFDAEWAISTFVKNTLSDATNSGKLFMHAFKSSVSYRIKTVNLAINYERINPDYVTLGAYFINNDFENVTFSPSFTLLNGRLNISANAGMQHNNLDNQKLTTSNRFVGSFNASYTVNRKLSVNAGYSNFSCLTKQNLHNDPFYNSTLDTLHFFQLSQNGSFSALYNFGNKDVKQNVVLNGSYQVASQSHGLYSNFDVLNSQKKDDSKTQSINELLFYNISHSVSKTSLGIGINANSLMYSNTQTLYYGPNINLSRAILNNKLKLTLSGTYNQSLANTSKMSEIIRGRFALTYSPKLKSEKAGRFNLNLSADYLIRFNTSGKTKLFNEFTCNIGAAYGF